MLLTRVADVVAFTLGRTAPRRAGAAAAAASRRRLNGWAAAAHAPSTDLYVRSRDTSGLIVIIAHASVNARPAGRAGRHRSIFPVVVVAVRGAPAAAAAAPGPCRPPPADLARSPRRLRDSARHASHRRRCRRCFA